MAGTSRSSSEPLLLPSAESSLERFLHRRVGFKLSATSAQDRRHFLLGDAGRLGRYRPPQYRTAPPAMQASPPLSPVSPNTRVTVDSVSGRRRSLSFAPKTPSRLSVSYPLSPPVSPEKGDFLTIASGSTTLVGDEDAQKVEDIVAEVRRPLSFAASGQRKGRKGPPSALDLSPKKKMATPTTKKDLNGTQETVERPKLTRLNLKILEGIERRGGHVPPVAAEHVERSPAFVGPSLPVTPKSGYGAHMGMLGLGLVSSPLPLSALSPPAPARRKSVNISHAQASAVGPITAIHRGRQMTFSPLPPEPDQLGRCTLIDEEGEPVTVFPRELQNWVYLPWVYWGMVCGRAFNLWFEPRQ